jgi:hypothetical protein
MLTVFYSFGNRAETQSSEQKNKGGNHYSRDNGTNK